MEDKLSLINHALALTGNNEVSTEEDGSEEWRVSSAAYEGAVKTLLGGHDWKFGTKILALQRAGDFDDPDFEDAYAKPPNTLGLAWVRTDNYPSNYKVVGNQILTTAGTNGIVTAKVVLQPDDGEFPPLFLEALRSLIKAGCYEGLNEDPVEARNQRGEAQSYLALARSHSDKEGTPRAGFRSRILARRRGRIVSRP